MPLREKVFHAHLRAFEVLHSDGVGSHATWLAVDEDDRESGPHLRRQVVLPFGRRHEDEAVDATGHEVVDEGALAIGLLVQAGREDGGPPVSCRVLQRAQQGRGEAVAHVLQEGADEAAATLATAEVARAEVVPVVQSAHGVLDSGPHAIGDPGLGVDDPETVLMLTPANAATSRIVARPTWFTHGDRQG